MSKQEERAKAKREALIAEIRKGTADIHNSPAVKLSIRLTKLARLDWAMSKDGREGPPDPVYDQLYRAINSVGANILEGFARGLSGYRSQFYLIARGSAEEAVVHAQCLDWEHLPLAQLLCSHVDTLILTELSTQNDGDILDS